MEGSLLSVSFSTRIDICKNRMESISLHMGSRLLHCFHNRFKIYVYTPTALSPSIKNIDNLPLRIQRFRIRLMRFRHKIVVVHGSEMRAFKAHSISSIFTAPSIGGVSHIIEQHTNNY